MVRGCVNDGERWCRCCRWCPCCRRCRWCRWSVDVVGVIDAGGAGGVCVLDSVDDDKFNLSETLTEL
ncbi:hypothetical protein Hanom_Chr08g00735161 [Helianthus anomalus]